MSSISASELQSALGGPGAPIVLDVRRRPAWHQASEMVSGALRRDPEAVARTW